MGEMVAIELDDGSSMPAYAARPGGTDAPGVVILQEIFGINANIRAITDDYASRGYAAIAPDLFWRQEVGVELDPANAEDRDRATTLMKGLDQPRAVEDALAAARHLRSRGAGKMGAVGYCLGGKLAYMLAARDGIDAAVSYYGVAIQAALGEADALRCPLLLHIAEDDHLCPPEAQRAIRDALGPRPGVTIMSHVGVGHAFARRGGGAFDAVAAERANQATAAFFATHLRGGG